MTKPQAAPPLTTTTAALHTCQALAHPLNPVPTHTAHLYCPQVADTTRERLYRTHSHSTVAQKYESVFFRPGDPDGMPEGGSGDKDESPAHNGMELSSLPVIKTSGLPQPSAEEELKRSATVGAVHWREWAGAVLRGERASMCLCV